MAIYIASNNVVNVIKAGGAARMNAELADNDPSDEDFLRFMDREIALTLAPTLAFLVTLMVGGLVGNSIVFLVYYKKAKSSTANCYILALSVCDLLINAIALPTAIWEIAFNSTFYTVWACKMIRSIRMFLVTLSIGIVVSVAVDRQRSICNMRPCRSYSLRSVYMALAICTSVSLLLSAPYAIITGNRKKTFSNYNVTGVMCTVSDEYGNSWVDILFHTILSVAFFVCLIIIVVSYTRLMLHLLRHKQLQSEAIKGTENSKKCFGSKNNEREIQEKTALINAEGRDVKPSDFQESFVNSISSELLIKSLPDMVGDACTIMSAKQREHLYSSVRSLGQSRTEREHSSNRPSPRDVCPQVRKIPTRTNFMLFVLTIVFIISFLPFLVIAVMTAKRPQLVSEMNINLNFLCRRSFFINCVVNPVIYSFCSAKFRQETRRLLSCKT